MLEESVIRCRDGKKFEQKYFRKGFAEKISVIRILDSRREKFKIGKAYEHKIDVINVSPKLYRNSIIPYKRKRFKISHRGILAVPVSLPNLHRRNAMI